MSTNALIGKERENNQVEYVYCHWDGYIEGGVGDTLARHYDYISVEELLKKGDMSCLESHLEDCVFYRDRGDTNIDSKLVSLEGYKTGKGTEYSVDYKYLFAKNNNLYCYETITNGEVKEIEL